MPIVRRHCAVQVLEATVVSGNSGIGLSKHRKAGFTKAGGHSPNKRLKVEMEREANRPKRKRIKPPLFATVREALKWRLYR